MPLYRIEAGYNRRMRHFHFRLAPLLVCALAGTGLFAQAIVMDEIVCKVNGEIVTRNELEKDRRDLEAKARDAGLKGVQLDEAVKANLADLLRDRIDHLLLVQRGKEMDIKVDSDLAKYIGEKQRQTKIADPEKFQAMVREQTGMSYEDWRANIRESMVQDRVIGEEVSRKITFKREQLEAYYNAHQDEFHREERVILSALFVSTVGLDDAGQAAAEKKAKDLVARANKGENFADLVKQNSDDANTSQDGGVQPPYTKSDSPAGDHLDPKLEALVWDKARGYVTDPVKIDGGFLILRVNEHQKAGLASFEEVQGAVQSKMFEPLFPQAIRAYLTKLRVSAFLEIKPGYLDSGAAPNKDTAWVDPAQLKPETIKKEEVLAQSHHKHIFGFIPIPGTNTAATGTSSSR
jgi:parvulin-like peptidyl-prolyl isomerase